MLILTISLDLLSQVFQRKLLPSLSLEF